MRSIAKPPLSARELCHQVLVQPATRGQPATRRLDELLAKSQLSPSERGLATDLVHGVVRRRATLDALLRQHVSRPLDNVESPALTWLQMASWELLFSNSAPQYAILNETAECVKRQGKPHWTGFINGVLRSVTRDLTEDYSPEPAANAIPCEPGKYRRVRSTPFADPGAYPRQYFCAAFSFPEWLVERWERRLSRDELLRLGFWFNAPPVLTLRANLLATTRDALLASWQAAGLEATAGLHPQAIRLAQSARVTQLPGFDEGWFVVQDESAMAAASLLQVRPGQQVLDLCAAPGGKTTHLAELMQNRGELVAADVDDRRLKLVSEACARLKISIVRCEPLPREMTRLPWGPFDAVLLDVPCSNSGVLGKRPEVRWRLMPTDLDELPVIQLRLLKAALLAVRRPGRVVYSTCSIEPEENEQVVRRALEQHPEFHLLHEVRHRPGEPGDGGYQALLATSPGVGETAA